MLEWKHGGVCQSQRKFVARVFPFFFFIFFQWLVWKFVGLGVRM